MFSEAENRWVTAKDIEPDRTILELMRQARNAPCTAKGLINENQPPAEFRKWRDFAFGELRRRQPERAEDFLHQVAGLLTSLHRMGPYGHADSRAIGMWAYRAAVLAPGRWRRPSDLDVWGRVLSDAGFQLALRPNLAAQLRIYPEIATLRLSQLEALCQRHGIAEPQDNNRITCQDSQHRVVVLTSGFVETLELAYDLEDPLAAAINQGLSENRPGAPSRGGGRRS